MNSLIKVTAAAAFLVTPPMIASNGNPPSMPELRHRTFTYKTVGHLEIQAEVTRSNDDQARPVLVWIHGGAMVKGDRFGQWEKPFPGLMLEAGYIIVSIDYRLAPESKLPAIVEDIADACAWVRAQGPPLFGARVDRLAVAGGSAGGYLALAAGNHVSPRPTVLASFSGYCDLVGPWATGPSIDPDHMETNLSPEEAAAFTPGPPISNKYERTYDITPFYNYWRRHGQWPFALTGWDPVTDKEKYLPYLNDRGVTPDYPPTIQVHGTRDLDVDYEQAVQMNDALEKHGVTHQLILLEGANHNLRGIDPGRTENAHRKAMAFVRAHMEE
jgi:acetyl esterase/lipase